MKIIGRYVLKEHVGAFLFASTALTSLMLLQYVAKQFGHLVGKGLPASVISEFLLLSLPFTIAMTMPMAVLVAVLYAFSRLASENEITAMKASGLSMWTVLGPVLLGGLAMSIVMIAFNDQVLPRANHRLAVLQLDIIRTKPTFSLREQVINTIRDGQLYLRAGEIDEASGRMKEVVIYDLGNAQRRRTTYADSGVLALAPNRRDLEMMLYDGEMREVPNNRPAELTRMFFERDRVRVANVMNSFEASNTGSVSKSDREMSVCEMLDERTTADLEMRTAQHERTLIGLSEEDRAKADANAPRRRQSLGIASLYCGMLSFFLPAEAQAQGQAQEKTPEPTDWAGQSQIAQAEARYEQAFRTRNRYDVEIHKKFALAAACVIFVLIGAPIALRFPRGGVGLVIGVSFSIFGLYYVGLIGGEELANYGYVPPWLAMWSTDIILALVGLALAARMGRESSTTRGGDFSEMVAMFRARIGGTLRRIGVDIERRRA